MGRGLGPCPGPGRRGTARPPRSPRCPDNTPRRVSSPPARTCMMVLRIFHSRYVSSSSSMAAATSRTARGPPRGLPALMPARAETGGAGAAAGASAAGAPGSCSPPPAAAAGGGGGPSPAAGAVPRCPSPFPGQAADPCAGQEGNRRRAGEGGGGGPGLQRPTPPHGLPLTPPPAHMVSPAPPINICTATPPPLLLFHWSGSHPSSRSNTPLCALDWLSGRNGRCLRAS